MLHASRPRARIRCVLTFDRRCVLRAHVCAEGLGRLKHVHSTQKSMASLWGAASRSKDAEIPRSVGT